MEIKKAKIHKKLMPTLAELAEELENLDGTGGNGTELARGRQIGGGILNQSGIKEEEKIADKKVKKLQAKVLPSLSNTK
jgi:hypothetical protein